MRFIDFIVLLVVGIGLIIYAFPIVRTLGQMDWAERFFGTGGTYTAWKAIGLLLILASFWVLVHGV